VTRACGVAGGRGDGGGAPRVASSAFRARVLGRRGIALALRGGFFGRRPPSARRRYGALFPATKRPVPGSRRRRDLPSDLIGVRVHRLVERVEALDQLVGRARVALDGDAVAHVEDRPG
jgi:hypothetical protein